MCRPDAGYARRGGRADPDNCANVENQTFAGLSGAIVVGDDRRLLPPALRHIATHTLVLKDIQIAPNGHIVQGTADNPIDSNAPTVRLVNGELRPTLRIHPGETQLWRLANAGADIFYRLQLDGYRVTVIGDDGDPVAHAWQTHSLLLPPGKRYDVLVTASRHAGATWLRTLPYSNGPQGDAYPDVPLMKVDITGRTSQQVAVAVHGLPTAARNLANAPITRRRAVVMSESPDGLTFFINGKAFDMSRSVFSTPAIVNSVEQWTITNTSGEVHPFHLHVAHFQVMSVNGRAVPYTGEVDTVPVPTMHNGVPGRVVIRIDFADFTGRWMFHCHILAHEGAGMMSYINVVPPPRGFDRHLLVSPV